MNRRLLALCALLVTDAASAQNADQLAKQLANPLAALTSVLPPFSWSTRNEIASAPVKPAAGV